jgi:hypothetical protein
MGWARSVTTASGRFVQAVALPNAINTRTTAVDDLFMMPKSRKAIEAV